MLSFMLCYAINHPYEAKLLRAWDYLSQPKKKKTFLTKYSQKIQNLFYIYVTSIKVSIQY